MPPFGEMLRTLAAWGIIPLSACATLPDVHRVERTAKTEPVKFETARGPVSKSTSAGILKDLKSESGPSEILRKHLALEEAINRDSPLVLGNRLVLLQDGPATYKAMFAAIRAARDHINLETYIFDDSEIGSKFATLLQKKQAAGVQVNLIYDSVGCLDTPKEFFEGLRAAGVRTLEFNPVNPAN
ncbi:MAG: cardiolipin synthase B, partial [Thiobacillus sp.]|nr:cardiolipin synthase B [Thiobacillus sp.]